MRMHKPFVNISLRKSVEQSLHYASLSTPSCFGTTPLCVPCCCGKNSRVFGSLTGNSTTTRTRRCVANGVKFSQQERLWSDKKPAVFIAQPTEYNAHEQNKQANNKDEYAFFLSETEKDRLAGETISLFSVDQIREQESPWKALTGIANADRLIRRGSPFKRRLQERKKICMLYGNLQKRALNRYLKEIHRPEELLLALESRLDVVLKRSALFPSIHSARQSILKGGISVNRTKVRSPRYHCTPGDLIEIIQKKGDASKPFFKGDSQVEKRQQNKDYLTRSDKWLDLFAFSELLQLGGRRIGRLYTSALAYVEESMNVDSSTLKQRNKKGKAHNSFCQSTFGVQAGSLQNTPLRQQSPAISLENQKFQVDTPLNPLKDNTAVTCGQERKALNQRIFLSMGFDSSNSEKKVVTNRDFVETKSLLRASASQFLARENAESERPRVVASRPLHLEVSYRNLCVVFLYPPQRICVDISIDLSLLV